MTGTQLVESYINRGLKVVFWPSTDPSGKPNEWKGPREPGWLSKTYTLDDYHEGDRVGIMHGVEIEPGKFVVDVDIDWGPGVEIAKAMLPTTFFIWGRASKRVSHCLYTCPDVIPMYAYKDVGKDGVTLIEFRSDKHQSMSPPSVWRKDGREEQLTFVVAKDITFVESASKLKQRVCLSAIGMLLSKHLGRNGFGHESRLAWAGFLLRLGIPAEDLITMGEAMSLATNNTEVSDVRRVVESTASGLTNHDSKKKIAGGPALAKIIGEHGKAVINRIREWVGHDSGYIRSQDGLIIKDNQENIRHALQELGYELQYQEFAERALIIEGEKPPRPLDDRTMTSIWLRIDRECRFRPTYTFFEKVVSDTAYDNGFHPVRDYLRGLSWDNEPRINTWLHVYGGAVDADVKSESDDSLTYLEAISSIVLIAAVRRVMHPGCKYDEMLVLESQQGFSKSSALRALCPRDEWFSDDLPLNVDAKEIIERTLGKWIIEASDLVGGRKAERDHLKSMLSRQIDGPARMAYAHQPVERPRQFIIIGSTNDKQYLADATGSRRFWPVKVGRFDVEGITRDRDQLWAEAVVREARGESIRLPEVLWSQAGEHQERRREVDAWEDILHEVAVNLEPKSGGQIRVATSILWEKLGIEVARRDRTGAKRISEIMQRMGFEATRVREDGKVQVGYERKTPLEQHSRRALDEGVESQF